MEQALMAVCKDIRLGKILIQTNHDTGEPEVRVYSHLNFISLFPTSRYFNHMTDEINLGCYGYIINSLPSRETLVLIAFSVTF